jgi:hypothetical protein
MALGGIVVPPFFMHLKLDTLKASEIAMSPVPARE